MTETEQRAAVVAEARKWIGTPYHNCADLKGVGVDCGMLLVRVFCDLGLIEKFDPRPYPADWHLHRSEERYLGFVRRFGKPVEVPAPGDVAMFKYGRCAAHGGVVTRLSPLTIVHAYRPAGLVLEDEVEATAAIKKRMHGFYSYWA
jgi:cell wall-associated NlpC family hydrolase